MTLKSRVEIGKVKATANSTAEFSKSSRWNQIDWGRIGRSIEFYSGSHGHYRYVEAPWIVDEKYTQVTYPHGHAFKTSYGDLVGSAEQGLLALSAEGKIPDSSVRQRYVACGPCFRDHQPDDKFHNPYFMKVELYLPHMVEWNVGILIKSAAQFFASEGAIPEIVKTEEGWDIYVAGIEVGSYGFREVYDHMWVYGTGLAEPRFSQALRLQTDYIEGMTK